MGEAKVRARRWEAVTAGLSPVALQVAEVSRDLFNHVVRPMKATGMCYRLSFFTALYLEEKYGIEVEPVVGFVNDGTGPLMASHAWTELDGLKIDLALCFTESPAVQYPGEGLILDRVFHPGHAYAYHRERTPQAIEALNKLARHPDAAGLARAKEQEHEFFSGMVSDRTAWLRYLNAAPDGVDYAALVRVIKPAR